jgi:ElaB/YqjD/DUF883 family membrane-anchored ribosome-binding protein
MTSMSTGAESFATGGIRSQSEELKEKVGDALDKGRAGISDSALSARDSLRDDMAQLRTDLAGIKDTIARFVNESSGEAASTAKKVGEAVATQVGAAASTVAEAGSEMASSAKEQVKTFASELERFARRQPLGALAGALFVGVVVGFMTRGRD